MSQPRDAARLGAYRLLSPLQGGRMAEVFLAEDGQGRSRVVKVAGSTQLDVDADAWPRFDTEVRAMAALRHPNVVRILAQGHVTAEEAARGRALGFPLAPGAPWLAMERADATLAPGPQGSAPRDWPRARRFFAQLLGGLAHAHSRGVIHRDIKPSNVLHFAADDHWKLADFGIARLLDAHEDPSVRYGTPHYMAPEQVLGEPGLIGPWTDLYAFGVLAFELLSGRLPFSGPDSSAVRLARLSQAPAPFTPVMAVPAGMAGWLRRLMARSPAWRFRSAPEALHALTGSVEEGELVPPLGQLAGPGSSATTVTVQRTAATLQASGAGALAEQGGWDQRPGLPPIPRFDALDALDGPAADDRAAPEEASLFAVATGPLVGREAERGLLWSALGEVHRDQHPRIIVLRGAAGVGKTRLCRWLRTQALERGAVRQTLATDAARGEGLVGSARRLTGVASDQPERRWTQLRAWLPRPRTAPDEALEEVARRLFDERASAAMADGRAERWLLLERLLAELAFDRPLVLLVDDAHRQPDALETLRHTLRPRRTALPLLALVAVRDEDLDLVPGARESLEALLAAGATSLSVEPLSRAETSRLLQGAIALDAETNARLCERSGGNPMFALGLAADAERGEALPATLRQVWSRRLAKVAADAAQERALGALALLGGEVRLARWLAVCVAVDAGEALEPLLLRMLDEGLLELTDEGGEPAARWVQPLVRETATARLAPERARALHLACAEILERPGAGDLSDRVAIGRHYLRGGAPERAAEPLIQGAREALAAADYWRASDALAEHSAAVEALGGAGPGALENALLRARLLRYRGDMERSAAVLASALGGAAGAPHPRLSAELRLTAADVARCRGLADQADDELARAEALLTGHPDAALALLAVLIRGELALFRGSLESADTLADAAYQAAQLRADERLMGRAAAIQMSAAALRGDSERALEAGLRTREHFVRCGFRYGIIHCENVLGEACRQQGDLERAEAHYRACLALNRDLGGGDDIFARANLCLVRAAQGDDQTGVDELPAVIELVAQRGRRALEALMRLLYAACLAGTGRLDAAADELQLARAELDAGTFTDRDGALQAERLATLADAQRRPDLASSAAALALILWRRLGSDPDVERAQHLAEALRPR